MASTAEDGLHCVVAGGSLVGLSAAIALSRLGMDVTVLERSPARAVEGGGGLGVDAGLATPGEIPGALSRYQELRLGPAARHVAISEQATADYLAHAAAGRRS